jgi:hypothetical protein
VGFFFLPPPPPPPPLPPLPVTCIFWGRQDGEFRSFLKENAKLSVYEVSNDGNSLFKAVTHQLYGPGKDFMQVRKACCDWMVL